MDGTGLRTALKRLGLSEKEVEAYLATIECSEITMSVLADEADVSVRHVYKVAEQLEQRGLVVVNDHITPTTLQAIPPSEAISQLKGNLSAIESELNSRFEEHPFESKTEVFKSKPTLFKRFQESISKAENEILLSVPVEAMPGIADDLQEALDRGVLILLLVTNTETSVSRVGTIASVMRTTKGDFPAMMSVDRRDGFFSPTDMFRRTSPSRQGIYLQQDQFVPILISAFLGNYWGAGREAYISRPSDLPREYTSFCHAMLDATCNLRRTTELHAEIKARPVSGGDGFETIDGRVVDTEQSIIDPPSNSRAIKNTLFLETDDVVVSIGGPGAFLEDFEAKRVRLTQ
ncbi:TrmB family transcriptional regulator [Natronococcus pandeyae]|uniref:TrmB family transcriptional regulator n=1 Tax=Natronococcus pandeyae TaxID=2055836 RepID=A0A8J8Q3B1_9EURY|nr:TrmB family transcriptional regulator sugar-binding domain-containing protein [Natronococcus pandeyae]TYL37798.1 TrmB family transcriptional regulator [Natronococcus pandeyae]